MNEMDVCKPGEVILRKLFHEFTLLADKKIDAVLSNEPLEKQLAKSLQRGEDPIFDQLLIALGSVAEHCLPSQLRILFDWYQKQIEATEIFAGENQRIIRSNIDSFSSKSGSLTKSNIQSLDNSDFEIYYILEKRDLAVEFLFCLVLIEVLKQLHLHPGYDDLTNYIENLAFKHFKFREDAQSNPNLSNINMIADLYAEVIGVLAQSRFQSVRKRFMAEFLELRAKELSPITTHNIISLLMGMKFFRIKMVPIEEFEASFQFMHDCAVYFLDVKDKDIKHALAGLFVEILVPVAATVKNEVNVPCLKNFVELLYSSTLDLCTKKKHCLALFPLVTCLLCVSQKAFFLSNWHYFLAMCLSHLKNRDSKMSRVALESLYRLLWVYMIRIKCESNTATQSRLHSIVNSLFPKGSKAVVPRDTPLNIFVKIIQFIAQERLDFAMKEIVFDLLSVGRSIKIILTPERMSIGLRSFLVVADSLQQKDGEPPMPRTLGVLPSGNTLRVKKTFLNKMLTDEMAKNIGMNHYYPYVRKTLSDILRALDSQFGRPLMMTCLQNLNKEPDDMITGERKPKIDLFRTCVAAIPRLIPDGISKNDLIDLLSRLTVHMDEEMNVLAFQSLQNLVVDFADWREDVIEGFIHFILYEINDTFPTFIENSLRMLLQLLTSWKNALQQQQATPMAKPVIGSKTDQIANVLYNVEALALVMLCYCRQPTRRLAAYILKESRLISNLVLPTNKNQYDEPVAFVIDATCPIIIENCFPYISSNERSNIVGMSYQVDLQWLAERSGNSWVFDRGSENTHMSDSSNDVNATLPEVADVQNFDDELKLNAWNVCLMALMPEVVKNCPNAVAFSWPIICQRLNTLFTHIDPNPVNDNRAASILRTTSNLKRSISSFDRSFFLELWKNYLMFACTVAPSSVVTPTPVVKHTALPENCASPDSMSEKLSSVDGNRSPIMNRVKNVQSLFKQILPLLRCDHCDLRNAAVLGLSQVNQYAFADLLEELIPYFREAIDRKQENVRRRKRREMLRLQISRLFKFISERKIFALCPVVLDRDNSLSAVLVEYIDGVRLYFESEGDKESNSYILDIKESYCHFVCNLFHCFPIDLRRNKMSRELRNNLFNLFATWSGKQGVMFVPGHSNHSLDVTDVSNMSELEYLAVKSMSSVLCAGSVFDASILDGNSLYIWLTNLLNANDKRLNSVGLETLILLLENNLDAGSLLEWLIECCYTKNSKIADSCFTALATIFSIREYPCDRYIAIIIVTIVNVACARIEIQQLALQLLQILDNRFFCSTTNFKDQRGESHHPANRIVDMGATVNHVTHGSTVEEDRHSQSVRDGGAQSFKESEPLLLHLYPCSQFDISKRMAYLHPQLTMIVFSEITYRFQTARPTVCQNLLSFLVPWLHNMQLVDPTVPQSCGEPGPDGGYSFSRSSMAAEDEQSFYQREGWGSVESTQMVLNNLFYITIKFGDDYASELEKVWASLCANRPYNQKIIIRYLFILTGLASNELLPYAKQIAIYLARAQPERVIDELMTELQAVEFLSFNAERTEAFPYFRIINRKCSTTHLDDDTGTNAVANNSNQARKFDYKSNGQTEIGMLHTKRHSKDLHSKYDLGSVDPLCAKMDQYRNYDSFNGSASSEEYNIFTELSNMDDSLPLSDRYTKPSTPQPRPLPMPEYGGYYAPLNDFLPANQNGTTNSNSNQNIGFHRCNLSLMLLCDIITQDISVDWSPHIPLMLHILFLGMDHNRPIVYEHCKQLLLNLLIVTCKHNDNLNVARILLNNRTQQQNYGLSIPLSFPYNFNSTNLNDSNSTAQKNSQLDLNQIFTKSSENIVSPSGSTTEAVTIEDIHLSIDKNDLDSSEENETLLDVDKDASSDTIEKNNEMNDSNSTKKSSEPNPDLNKPPKFSLDLYMKTLIDFISSKRGSPLWNYEDITAKVWTIKSSEQMSCFVEHVLIVFKESLSYAKIENRWADIALQLALSCSSRHYAGRSLQIFRALKIPINTRMLSDILSRLIETVSEQGEDMQGYVTELMLTLESAIDSFDLKPRNILDLISEYFHFENVELDYNDVKTDEEKEKKTEEQGDEDEENSQPLDDATANATHSTSSSATIVTPTMHNSQSHVENFNKKLRMPTRSTSYSMSFPSRRFNFLDDSHRESHTRFRTTTDVDSFYSLKNQRSKCNSLNSVALGRSQSAQSLKNDNGSDNGANTVAGYTLEDKTSILAQFFWISVILLETDYEHEFQLAIRVLDKVLHKISLDDIETQEKIEKLLIHFKWHHFPGVHALVLKGLQSPVNYEFTINLLHKLTPYLKIPVIDPTKSEVSFPFHIMAMLPYLLHNYDDPNTLCIQAAVSFAQWCNETSNKLENLATVMTLYSKRCFSKENSQWTKCVVKYLCDAYSSSFVSIISFLVEVAEKGPQIFLNHILTILHSMLNYIDLSTTRLIHDDILSMAAKYMEGPQWKEALKILKLAVDRSSTLATPSYSSSSNYGCGSSIISSIVSCGAYSDCVSLASSSFTDSEFSSFRRELPGRTMDFTFDLSDAPIVGFKFIQKRQMMNEAMTNSTKDSDSALGSFNVNDSQTDSRHSDDTKNDFILNRLFEEKDNQPAQITNANSTSNNCLDTSTLKRSGASQNRIRERLISLLNRCGQRSGGLPKSPSVIFSQNSDIVEHKSSMASSVEDISATNNDMSGDSKHDDAAHGEFAFKEFDFLEYELESQEGESLDNFNWGVRRKSLSNLDNDLQSTKTLKAGHSDTLKPHTAISFLSANKAKPSNDDFSSDDEVESVSPLYEMSSEITSRATPLPSFNESSIVQSRPASLISHESSHSLGSEGEFPLNTSTACNPSLLLVNDVEEQWSSQFIQLINDTSGTVSAMGNHILSVIFKNTFKRVIYLTRESCDLLSQVATNHQHNSISSKFLELLDIISSRIDFPFIFIDPKLFTTIPNLLERHRFYIIELHAHWETFTEKKDVLFDFIQTIKSSEKAELMEDSSVSKLCIHLYKMYFQLFLLFECYLKYVDLLQSIITFTQVNNYSAEIASLKKELNQLLDDPRSLPKCETFNSQIDGPTLSKENEKELKELIQSKELTKALCFVKALKDTNDDLSGDDLIQTLLTIYCRIEMCSNSNFVVITEPEHSLREVTCQLMDTSVFIYNSCIN